MTDERQSASRRWLAGWAQASRPIAQLNIFIPLVLGQALAWGASGRFSMEAFAWVHIFGLFDHLFIVYANDYADAEADANNRTHQIFSGGSRVIPEGKLTKRDLLIGALVMLMLLIATSAYLAFARELPLMLVLGASAILLMHGYSFAPVRASYRGHGEVLQGLGLGVVLPLVGYYVQAGSLDGFPWLICLPVYLFWHSANISSSLPDTPSDRLNEKHTHPVRWGEARSRRDSIIIIAAGLLVMPFASPELPIEQRLALITPSLLLLIHNWRLVGDAESTDHERCKRFVIANVTAVNFVQCMWGLAIVMHHAEWR